MRTIPNHWFLLAAVVILGLALGLRVAQIDRRPFHADEGVQAYQTWQLLRGDGYTYDPTDKHGPFLYYAAAGLTKLTGGTAHTLTESGLRGITLLAGLGTIILLLAHASPLGRPTAIITAALVATAPFTILYDTYFVQETWFAFFTWALLLTAWRFLAHPSIPLAATIGLLAGLMQVTKETSVIHFAALGIALILMRPRLVLRSLGLPAAVAAGVFAAIYLVFYSAGFTHGRGVLDGLLTYRHYFGRATAGPDGQPWFYYLAMLWPHTQGGVRWGEPLLLGASLVGLIAAFRPNVPGAIRVMGAFTLALIILYSVIPYKMPWLLLTPYIGLCGLAGYGIVQLGQCLPDRWPRMFGILILGLFLVYGNRARQNFALDRYANDPRNPYLYQQTSADLMRLVKILQQEPPATSIAVVSEDHAWPLPWYLRDHAQVGYFATPPENLPAYHRVLWDTRLDLKPTTAVQIFGLRPNVLLWLTQPQSAR